MASIDSGTYKAEDLDLDGGNIKIDLTRTGCMVVQWICLTKETAQGVL